MPKKSTRAHRHLFRRASEAPSWATKITETASRWRGVTTAPFFQWSGLFAQGKVFAAVPRRMRDSDILVRLTPEIRRRLVADGLASPYAHGSRSGWVRFAVPRGRPSQRALQAVRLARRLATRR